MTDKPSTWQERITGEWHGMPSIFDAAGNHVGNNKVFRESSFEGTRVTYMMDTRMDAVGPLRARFEASEFSFGVDDRGGDRVYMGPDVFGNGIAYGRSLYTSQHFYGEALKIRGREFIIDDDFTMSIVWDWLASDKRKYMSFGLFKWEQGEQVLKASY